jgi:hypothetical protein
MPSRNGTSRPKREHGHERGPGRGPLDDRGHRVRRQHAPVGALPQRRVGIARHRQHREDHNGERKQHPLLPAHGADQEEREEPVRRDDVPGVEQDAVHESDQQHPQAPAPDQPADLPPRRARLLLTAHQLPHPVPEEHAEQRERPAVDDRGDRARDRGVERRAVEREADEVTLAPQEVVGVGEGDEQQHHAAGEVGREYALGQAGRAHTGLRHASRKPVLISRGHPPEVSERPTLVLTRR